MDIVMGILLVFHMIGWAIVLGAALTSLRQPRLAKGVTHGAWTAVIVGILMVGAAEMSGWELSYAWVGVKLIVGLGVLGMSIYGASNEEKVTRGYLVTLAGLVIVNICVAVLWG
ncbi:hypothetical protein GCM10023169_13670 [Georgenia halophila]|uniref:Integral membrane protein n=1 Tax=Georgenia halophila TaxID=620889 RepID=A0ABP8KVQ9_9MICO